MFAMKASTPYLLVAGIVAGYFATDQFVNGPQKKALQELQQKINQGTTVYVRQPGVKTPEWNKYHHRELHDAGIDYDVVGEEAISLLKRRVHSVGNGLYSVTDISNDKRYGGLPDAHPVLEEPGVEYDNDLDEKIGFTKKQKEQLRKCFEDAACRGKTTKELEKAIREMRVK